MPSTTSEPGTFLSDSSSGTFNSVSFVKALSIRWMVLEIVGWETLKMWARRSSVRLCRRYRRVIFRAWLRLRGSWSGGWFIPVEGLFEDFEERGELVAGEPGHTMVLQRSFSVVVRLFLAI